MARVTVEDCVIKVPNRFELVLLAAQRAREITSGAPLSLDRDDDKNPVVALREIADETVGLPHLREAVVRGMQKHVELDEAEETQELEVDPSVFGFSAANGALDADEVGIGARGFGDNEIGDEAELERSRRSARTSPTTKMRSTRSWRPTCSVLSTRKRQPTCSVLSTRRRQPTCSASSARRRPIFRIYRTPICRAMKTRSLERERHRFSPSGRRMRRWLPLRSRRCGTAVSGNAARLPS